MQIFITVLYFVCAISLFFVKQKTKIAILFFSMICFSLVWLPFGFFRSSETFINLCFLLSELPRAKKDYSIIKSSFIYFLMILVIISIVILYLSSPHYSVGNIHVMIFTELVNKYFILAYVYFSLKENEDLRPLMKAGFWGLLFITVVGVINFVLKSDPFVNVMMEGRVVGDISSNFGDKYLSSSRFRVQSVFYNPFCYGYICLMILVVLTYGHARNLIGKFKYYVAVPMCFFGILTCGCRTVLVCLLVGILTYVSTSFAYTRRVKSFIVLSLLSLLSYSFVPFVQDAVDNVFSVIDTNSTVAGSSIDMRSIQFAAVLYHIRDHEFFGRGKDYFNIDMGWSEGVSGLVDKDLYGIEGVYLNYLLERGYVGFGLYLIFYLTVIFFAFKRKKEDTYLGGMLLTLISVYLTFAFMTGELLSVPPTLLIMGALFRVSSNTKKMTLPQKASEMDI